MSGIKYGTEILDVICDKFTVTLVTTFNIKTPISVNSKYKFLQRNYVIHVINTNIFNIIECIRMKFNMKYIISYTIEEKNVFLLKFIFKEKDKIFYVKVVIDVE